MVDYFLPWVIGYRKKHSKREPTWVERKMIRSPNNYYEMDFGGATTSTKKEPLFESLSSFTLAGIAIFQKGLPSTEPFDEIHCPDHPRM